MAKTNEQFVAEITLASDQLKAGVAQSGRLLESFEAKSSKVFDQFSKVAIENIDKVNKQLEKDAQQFQKHADAQAKALSKIHSEFAKQNDIDVGAKFGEIAQGGKALLGSWLSAAGEVEQFRLTLTALAGDSAKADKELAWMRNYANITPFDLKGVIGAGVQLKTLKVDVERFLPLAGDLASVFNRDIKDSAQALAKALSGSQDGIMVLNDSFGITKRELKEAGANIGNAGAIALETEEDLRKLADAIEKVAQKKNFAGAVNQQLGTLSANVSQAEDAAFNLAAAIGETLAPAFIPLAQAATTVIDTIAGAPKPILAFIGGATALATGLAVTGAAALAFNTAMGGALPLIAKVVPALTGIQVAASGSAAATGAAAVAFNPLAAAVAALVLVGGGAALAINKMEQEATRAGAAIASQASEVARANREFFAMRDSISKATGAQQDFVYKGQDVADTLERVKGALEGVSGADFLTALQNGGVTFSNLSDKIAETEKTLNSLGKKRAIFSEFLKAGIQTPGVLQFASEEEANRLRSAVEAEIGKTGVTVEEARKHFFEIDRTYKQVQQTLDGLLVPSLHKAAPAFSLLTDAAENAKKVVSDFKINGDTDSLERNNKLLADASKQIVTIKSQIAQSGTKLDLGNINAIQDRLTSGSGSTEEIAALKGLIEAIAVRNKLEKQGADISAKATRSKVDAALEDARSLENAKERIVALRKVAETEGIAAEQKKQILAEVKREEKTLDTQLKQASKERVQQAIFEAQQTEGTTQQKINAINRVMATYQLEANVRRQLIREVSKLEEQQAKEREQRRKAEEDALSSESQRQQELYIQALDERIAKLQEEAEAGKNVNAELVAAMEERTSREISLIQEKSDARKKEADSSKVADQIEVTGALEVEAARRAGTDAINEQKKAQDARIKKLRDERKEALKAAKDEKRAREEVVYDVPRAPQSAQQGPSSYGSQNELPANSPGISLDQLAAQMAQAFSVEAGRTAASAMRQRNRDAQDEQRSKFAEANSEVVARLQESDAKRLEALAKKDEERQQKGRDFHQARLDQDTQRQTKAQAQVDAARGLNALDRTLAKEKRPMTAEEASKRYEQATLRYQPSPAEQKMAELAKQWPTHPGVKLYDPVSKIEPEAKKVISQQAQQQQKPLSGSLTIEVQLKGQQVEKAALKRTSANLDGQITDMSRAGDKFSFRVRT